MSLPLPTELYTAIIDAIPPEDRQQSILSLTRALPHAPIPIYHLFEYITLRHREQALHLTRRLLKPDGKDLALYVQEFSLQDEWTVDAEVMVNLLRKLPKLRSLHLCIGTNFAPEHLKAILQKPLPELQYLSLRFRPYVQKATYQQFLSGSYFDSTLSCLADWPLSDLPTLSIVQEPMDPAQTPKLAFAQPIVFFPLPGPSQCPRFLYPSVELLDLSTCNVFGAELTDTILARLTKLKHVILDNGTLLRGEYHAEDWAVLGKGCAIAGFKRTQEREKKMRQARLETAPVPAQERRPRRGRRGVSTATISLRASPPRDSRVVGEIDTPTATAMRKIRLYPASPSLCSFATTLAPNVTPDKHEEIRRQFEKGWFEGLTMLKGVRTRLYQSYRLGTPVMKFADVEESDGSDEGLDGLVERPKRPAHHLPPAAADETSSSWRIPVQKVASYIGFKTQLDKRPPIIFPPPSWLLEETQNNGAGASHVPDEPSMPKDISEDEVHGEDAPEPHLFAQRIGTLIDSLPPPAPTKDNDIGVVDEKGPPLSPSVDSKLMKLLSSESVMNGSLGRQSVWSMLERLKRQHTAIAGTDKSGEGKDDKEDHGVMMYAPLQPTSDSQVELADSETVLEYFDEPAEPAKSPPVEGQPAPQTKLPPGPRPQPDGRKSGSVTPSKSQRKPKEKEHIHWVPSSTQISLQAMWWGYRLYFPPPVMDLLDDTRLEATRRGAMVTAALKWLLDKIPVTLFPPQMRSTVLVLKRLTPFLGYVGVFIAWSWTAIKARDKGHGVVLTATWLLPVALVPTTLKAEDFLRPGEVAAAKGGKTPAVSTGSSAMSAAGPNGKVDTAKDGEPASAKGGAAAPTKSTDPGLKPNANGDSKADKSKTADPQAEKDSLSRRWSTLLLGRDKPKGKVDEDADDVIIVNMIVQAPRWTNAQMTVAPEEPFAPIRQATRGSGMRLAYVRNTFPHRGYIWNYGVLPQTWIEEGPLYACEIGERVAQVGDVRRVRVLGLFAVRDEGQLRWTLLVVDMADPLAARVRTIADLDRECPGLISATKEWLRLYKLADGKAENTLELNGEVQGIEFTSKILRTAHEGWRDIVTGSKSTALVDLTNLTIANSPERIQEGDEELRNPLKGTQEGPRPPAQTPSSISKWWYLGVAYGH
ncbi:F-box domain-containing protein [Mycena sanguinolenta]|uniref:inorganic diphosphatase n=1 Tax=Mycena sanguinolenta TaxID=230812 RepID=A0A8H6XBS8_9AGAR|nr:F-box domain-containing protein [Mycena sanguinolenta]